MTLALSLRTLVLASCCVLLGPGSIHAEFSIATDALNLVVDIETGSKHIEALAPGEVIQVHAVVDQLSGLTISAYQVGLDADESLEILAVQTHPSTGLVLTPTTGDVYAGLAELLQTSLGPHVLASWFVTRRPGFAADHPATLQMRDLENGEPSHYRGSAPAHHRAVFLDTGPVTIGPVAPHLVRFLIGDAGIVKGRSYSLEWETTGLENLTLDGEPVGDVGVKTQEAIADVDHVLRWTEDAAEPSRVISVDVIEIPVIDFFVSSPPPAENPNIHPTRWQIRGADAVWWDPGEEFISSQGERGADQRLATTFTIRAENEWGGTQLSISLAESPPLEIVLFTVVPSTIDLGYDAEVRWSTLGADRVRLLPDDLVLAPHGTMAVSPDTTTTYTLMAESGSSSAQAGLTVEVIPLRIETFRALEPSILVGESTTLEWSLRNAQQAWIEPGIGAIELTSSSIEIVPQQASTTYTLHAVAGERELTQSVTVHWLPPHALIGMDWEPLPREFMHLFIYVEHADSIRVDPGIGWVEPRDGLTDLFVPGGRAEVFTVTASNAGGTSQASHTYVPLIAEAGIYDPSPLPRFLGLFKTVRVWGRRSYRLEIEAPAILAESMVLEFDDYESVSFEFWHDEPFEITARAENFANADTSSRVLGDGLVPFVDLSVDEESLQQGDTTTLHWNVAIPDLVESLVIEPLGVNGGPEGSIEIQPDATTQYEVRIRGTRAYRWPEYRGLITVTVFDGETSIVAEPMRPQLGAIFDLQLTMPSDAFEARLLPQETSIEPRSQIIKQVAFDSVDYLLEVTTPRGIEYARVSVRPENTSVVSNLVSRIDFNANVRGTAVTLDWSVDAARPLDSIRVLRARSGESLALWQELGGATGELIDSNVEPGVSTTYQLEFEIDGERFSSDPVTVTPVRPARTKMLANVPNPFNPSTEIRWELAQAEHAQIEVYDLRGRRLRSMDLGEIAAGPGSWIWDGRNEQGELVATGTYLARLSVLSGSISRKITLLK